MNDTRAPAINTSLPVPIELVYLPSNRLIIKSHWSAPLRFLGAAPYSTRAFLLAVGPTALAIAGVIDYMTGRVVVQSPTPAACCAAIAIVGGVRTLLLVELSWATMRWRRGGPVEFDRGGNRVVFGPGTDNLTLPLSAVAALQLTAGTLLTDGGGVWEAVTADQSMPGYLLKWVASGTKMYQLNLVFKDGLRLNLANWRDWGEPQRELARHLAEFLKAPSESLPTT